MKRFTLLAIGISIFLFLGIIGTGYAQFTSGNIVAYRVGDGVSALSSASAAVFLDEYTIAGATVQSVAIPTSGANMLTVAGSSTAEGLISLSPDSYYLTLPGYNTGPGTAAVAGTTAAAVNRKLLRVDNAVGYTPMLSASAFSAANIRGGVTYLNNYWASGSNFGVQYFGTGSPTQVSSTVTNLRGINIFNGQLYFSTGSGTPGIWAVGSGLPVVTGQTSTVVISTGAGTSPYGFSFNSTSDICYVADDRSSASGGGVQKFTKSGGIWTLAYTLSVGTVGARGLTVDWSGANPIVYATTAEASANRIVKIIDVGVSSTFTLLNTAGTNTVYRGIAFSPIPAAAPSISASPSTLTGFKYAFGAGPSASQTYNLSGANLSPASGNLTVTGTTHYEVSFDNSNFFGSVNIAYTGSALASTTIYVRLIAGFPLGAYNGETVANTGGSAPAVNVTCSGNVVKPEPTNHVTGFAAATGVPSYSVINTTWTDATGATLPDGYLVKGATGSFANVIDPVDGTPEADATLVKNIAQGVQTAAFTGLVDNTPYYFKIYPYTNSGSFIDYKTSPAAPQATATTTLSPSITYTWQGIDGALWTVATNWSPTRTTPAINDILLFTGGLTRTVTGVVTQTIGKIGMSGNTIINLQSPAAAVLTINGVTGVDLDIPAGCALNMNAANAITISLVAGATASISGNMTFSSTVATAHRLTGTDASAITFNSGSVFTAGTNFSGNAFGNGTANSVIFANGSTYVHQAGSNPFVNNPPTSIVVFQTGSLYKLTGNSTPSFSGKTYANFEMDATGFTITVTGGSAVSVDNLTITNGIFNFNMTGTPGHSIKGNISVATGGILNFSPASAGTVSLNGPGPQTISGAGAITNSINSTLDIANPTGVILNTSNLTLNGNLKLTIGLFSIGTSNLILGATGAFTGSPATPNMVVATGTGQVRKTFPIGFTGSFLFPVGDNTGTLEYSPLTLNFASGTIAPVNYAAVNLVNAKYPTDPNTGSYLNRYWNIASAGITAFSCNATFQYVSADINGTESQISTTLVNPPPYVVYSLANVSLHQLTANGLTSFGTYTGSQIAPKVVTVAAAPIGAITATLNGTVQASNLSTVPSFDYGLTTNYGATVAGIPTPVTGNSVTTVSANLTGLTVGTTYHFRVKGNNLVGTTNGADLNFTTLCPLPVAAGTVSGPPSVCCPGTGYVYTVPVITDAMGYVWSLPTGAIVTAGGNTNSITVTYPAGSLSGNVSVYGSSVCGNGAVSANLPVTVHNVPAPTITGTTDLCVNSGYFDYTTEPAMTGYTWTISAGGVINYGAGTNVITVSWTSPGAQWVKVNYTDSFLCTAADPVVKNITVNPLPAAGGTIAGIPSVCANTGGYQYSVPPIANALTYIWNLPAGATITSGAESNSIVVSYSLTAVSGNITVQGINLCGSGTLSTPYQVIIVHVPGAAGTISGMNSVCEGDTAVSYTVPQVAYATEYFWTIPAGAIIVSGANTNSILVNFPAGASSGDINVYTTNFCGTGTVSPNFAVTVLPAPVAPVITATGNTLQSSVATGNQWFRNNELIVGATDQTYVADQSGIYTCKVILGSCYSPSSNMINIIMVGTGDKTPPGKVGVFPNPNNGQFVLTIGGNSAQETTYDMFVVNNLGVKVFELDGLKAKGNFQKNIDLRPAPDGVYTIILKNNDQNILRKIIIHK